MEHKDRNQDKNQHTSQDGNYNRSQGRNQEGVFARCRAIDPGCVARQAGLTVVKGFKGYQHTNGYEAYHSLGSGITVIARCQGQRCHVQHDRDSERERA